MALRHEEARVLASLIDAEADADRAPVTLKAVRLGCNQPNQHEPSVAYDDRTVEGALLSLKSIGLVRFVPDAEDGRAVRYRQSADDRWRLSPSELLVLATLVLGGPQTAAELAPAVAGRLDEDAGTVEEMLDTLAARSPEPFAVRLSPASGQRRPRYVHGLCGPVDAASLHPGLSEGAVSPTLAEDIADLRARLERIEARLGLRPEGGN